MKKYSIYRKTEWDNNNGLIWVKTFYESGYRKGNSYTTAAGAKRAAKRYIEKMSQEIPNSKWVITEEEAY